MNLSPIYCARHPFFCPLFGLKLGKALISAHKSFHLVLISSSVYSVMIFFETEGFHTYEKGALKRDLKKPKTNLSVNNGMLKWMVTESERFPTCSVFSLLSIWTVYQVQSNIFLFEKEILLDETEQFVPPAWCRMYYIISQKFIFNFVPQSDHRRLHCKDA